MAQSQNTPARGRPPVITRERIANAGIEMGLPNITFVGLSASLGVSHMALYKHVPSLKELKRLVAEEIFQRWEIPKVCGKGKDDLKDHLVALVTSLQDLVKSNLGLPPYLLRRSASTPQITAKIGEHHKQVADVYGIPENRARWIVATVAFHCIAVADTIYSAAENDSGLDLGHVADEAEVEAEFSQGMNALIVGALFILNKNDDRVS